MSLWSSVTISLIAIAWPLSCDVTHTISIHIIPLNVNDTPKIQTKDTNPAPGINDLLP